MSLTTREQKAVMTDFAGDGPFGPFPLKITKKSSFKVSIRHTAFDYGHNKSLCKITCI